MNNGLEQLANHAEAEVLFEHRTLTEGHGHSPSSPRACLFQEGRLSDPGLPFDDDQAPLAGDGRADALVDDDELRFALDEAPLPGHRSRAYSEAGGLRKWLSAGRNSDLGGRPLMTSKPCIAMLRMWSHRCAGSSWRSITNRTRSPGAWAMNGECAPSSGGWSWPPRFRPPSTRWWSWKTCRPIARSPDRPGPSGAHSGPG